MGRFVSIRGWLELDDKMAVKLRSIIDAFPAKSIEFNMTIEQANLYMKGWVFPECYINWTKYVFYGADIRLQGLDFIKALFEEVAQMVCVLDGEFVDFVEGTFFVDDEDEEIRLLWELGGGELIESAR